MKTNKKNRRMLAVILVVSILLSSVVSVVSAESTWGWGWNFANENSRKQRGQGREARGRDVFSEDEPDGDAIGFSDDALDGNVLDPDDVLDEDNVIVPDDVVDPDNTLDPDDVVDPDNTLDPDSAIDPDGVVDPGIVFDPNGVIHDEDSQDDSVVFLPEPDEDYDPEDDSQPDGGLILVGGDYDSEDELFWLIEEQVPLGVVDNDVDVSLIAAMSVGGITIASESVTYSGVEPKSGWYHEVSFEWEIVQNDDSYELHISTPTLAVANGNKKGTITISVGKWGTFTFESDGKACTLVSPSSGYVVISSLNLSSSISVRFNSADSGHGMFNLTLGSGKLPSGCNCCEDCDCDDICKEGDDCCDCCTPPPPPTKCGCCEDCDCDDICKEGDDCCDCCALPPTGCDCDNDDCNCGDDCECGDDCTCGDDDDNGDGNDNIDDGGVDDDDDDDNTGGSDPDKGDTKTKDTGSTGSTAPTTATTTTTTTTTAAATRRRTTGGGTTTIEDFETPLAGLGIFARLRTPDEEGIEQTYSADFIDANYKILLQADDVRDRYAFEYNFGAMISLFQAFPGGTCVINADNLSLNNLSADVPFGISRGFGGLSEYLDEEGMALNPLWLRSTFARSESGEWNFELSIHEEDGTLVPFTPTSEIRPTAKLR